MDAILLMGQVIKKHLYERLLVDGIPYFTNGAGGEDYITSKHPCQNPSSGITPITGRCWSRRARRRSNLSFSAGREN